MAWTMSACLRTRLHLADTAALRLRQARYWSAVLARLALRTQPGVFLSLSALSLGIITPLLPTSLTAAILLMTGIALAAFFGAGANLAGEAFAVRKTEIPKRRHQQVGPAPAAVPPTPPRLGSLDAAGKLRPVPHATGHNWAALMARINHELRTPLNAVVGFSEVMALNMFGPLGNARYEEYVRHIRDSAGDLLKSAEDTLALTSLLTDPRPAEAVVPCRLDHAVADAWAFLERKAAAREVALEVHLPEDVEALCEPRALRQILVNLMTEGLARSAPRGRVSLLAVADGELVEISVSTCGAPRLLPGAGSLAVCLARTLLEMQGTSLLEIEQATGWKAVTVLDRETQPDFFAAPLSAHLQAREAALAM
jgi:signal transduction histidine kinase